MRKTKHFSAAVLRRFEREGRGQGIFENYIPWHKVSRGDPSSLGRRHLVTWRNRFRELLSDGELDALHFVLQLPNVLDVTEQFPLALHPGPADICRYHPGLPRNTCPGAIELADTLGVPLRRFRDLQGEETWRPTTDLLVTFQDGHRFTQLAIAVKPLGWHGTPIQRRRLAIELEYWRARNVTWLLTTPELYLRSVALTLRRTAIWALGPTVPAETKAIATSIATQNLWQPLSRVLDEIAHCLGHHDLAQRALWQSVWSGELTVDLSRGWRPGQPLAHLSPEDFWGQNPIAMRRTSWNG